MALTILQAQVSHIALSEFTGIHCNCCMHCGMRNISQVLALYQPDSEKSAEDYPVQGWNSALLFENGGQRKYFPYSNKFTVSYKIAESKDKSAGRNLRKFLRHRKGLYLIWEQKLNSQGEENGTALRYQTWENRKEAGTDKNRTMRKGENEQKNRESNHD